MVYDWKDKVVLITGAATGIGAAVVNAIVTERTKVCIIQIICNGSSNVSYEPGARRYNQVYKWVNQGSVSLVKGLLTFENMTKHFKNYTSIIIR